MYRKKQDTDTDKDTEIHTSKHIIHKPNNTGTRIHTNPEKRKHKMRSCTESVDRLPVSGCSVTKISTIYLNPRDFLCFALDTLACMCACTHVRERPRAPARNYTDRMRGTGEESETNKDKSMKP